MKTTIKILLLVFTVSYSGCGKSDDDASATPQKTAVLSLELRTRESVEWNDFMLAASVEITDTQTQIDALRARIYMATARDKVNVRRTINKNEYALDKLQKSLNDHDAWFEKHIGTYTNQNATKIDAFKTSFQSRIAIIQAEISDCDN